MDSDSDDEPSGTPIVIQPSTSNSTPSNSTPSKQPKSQVRDLDELKRQVDVLEEAYPSVVRQVFHLSFSLHAFI